MSRIWDILGAFVAQFAVITVDNGYNTDIGATIVLYSQQRDDTQRPSIAIASRTGKVDRRDENGTIGRTYSRDFRQMEFVLEAGMSADPADEQRVAHDMLEDIDRVYSAIVKNNAAMPVGVNRISLTSWSVVDSTDGIDAVVLQVIGVVDYLTNLTT
jgi:hypothetical protein